jgi:hypothetical protein
MNTHERQNFIAKNLGVTNRTERAKSIAVGDFVNMEPGIFLSWSGELLSGDPASLKDLEYVQVVVESIDTSSGQITVSANGVSKRIDASLFGSLGRIPPDTAIFVTTDILAGPRPDNDPPSGYG